MTPSWSVPAMVLGPLALGTISMLLGPRWARALVLPGLAAMGALTAAFLAAVTAGGPLDYAVGGWAPPLGIALHADGLAAVMIAMATGVGVPVSLYARQYFHARASGRGFWRLWWFLWAALNALFLSGDAFNAYVTLELIGFSAVALVALDGSAVAVAAGLRYLLAALFGSLLYLMGVALLYGQHGTLTIALLADTVGPSPADTVALALMTVGLLVKTALFPLHYWLPLAHGSALTPVSALLSALVVKASFYLLLRIWFDLFGTIAAPAAAQLLGALGAAAVLWGAVAAFRERKLKMLVAYSTVAQIGYLFLLFPLAVGTSSEAAALAREGGVYYAVSHAFAKAAMFLAAGAIVHAWGEDDLEHLEGTSARLPWSLFAFGLAGVTLMGLPPSGGFIGKWLLLRSAYESGQWWWSVTLLAGGLLTAAYVFRVVRSAFVPPLPDRPLREIPRGMQVAAFALAAAGLALGLAAPIPLALLAVGGP